MNLEIIRQIPVPNLDGATGSVFNSRGNMVVVGRWIGPDGVDTVSVVELNGAGELVNRYDTGDQSLNLTSYIDFDPVRKVYAFANEERITILDNNLHLITHTEPIFERVTGVVFGDDGILYATDNNQQEVFVFDQAFELERMIRFLSFSSGGIDYSSNGDLLVTDSSRGDLFRMNTATGYLSAIFTGLGSGQLRDVLELPDRSLRTIDALGNVSSWTADGQFIHEAPGLGFDYAADGIAYYIPTPTAMSIIAIGGVFAASRHRQAR
ncbi:MAG: hypothetical protein H6813_06670 [Phycisphaeraceae bacterium]|nr:hypothetical protein [Phycisphaeraceae bacterium]MCB9848154.1 hypothetical protein [Phycisphaeraceae bacterium]